MHNEHKLKDIDVPAGYEVELRKDSGQRALYIISHQSSCGTRPAGQDIYYVLIDGSSSSQPHQSITRVSGFILIFGHIIWGRGYRLGDCGTWRGAE